MDVRVVVVDVDVVTNLEKTIVCDLKGPASVDDAVGTFEITVDMQLAVMQEQHALDMEEQSHVLNMEKQHALNREEQDALTRSRNKL